MSRVARAQCANCTCSPGLLSRARKSMTFAKRISLSRSSTDGTYLKSGSRKGSVFTLDPASLCLPEAKEVNTSKRLESLRRQMMTHDLAVYIIPSEDQHQSEYVSAFDQKRSFISGFSGSAGVAIVTRELNNFSEVPEGTAGLSTDGRYFAQATDELDFNWLLLKQGSKDQPTWEEWTVQQAIQLSLDSGSKGNIGIDPRLITYKAYQKINSIIEKQVAKQDTEVDVELVAVGDNLVNKIWEEFEELPPAATNNPITSLDISFTGQDTQEKLANIKKECFKDNVEGLVVTALDEIAWILNLRGQDIEFNPVFYSFMIITKDSNKLFIDSHRIPAEIIQKLQSANIEILPYESFYTSLEAISKEFAVNNKQFFIPDNASWEVVRNLKCSFTSGLSAVEDLKAMKNEVELQGAKIAHLKDGRALIKFFAWLEDQLINQAELIDECDADDKLTEFRKQEDNFVGLSFSTISASGANGAIIHYKPTKGQCAMINPAKIYLNDSGSQFLEGTTDTTRTIHFETPTEEEIRNYTLVLKGHIGLANLKFPENTTGNLIDSIARQHLWKYGLDYGHGTSHGIGAYLNVHEGPIGIGPRPNAAANPLKPGHLISNEPGYYEDGEYGIRLENVMYVKDSGLQYNGKKFLEFDTVTRVPFCKKLIDVHMLSDEELGWLNSYHATVWNDLSDTFEKHSYVYKWLKRETEPLAKA
ncbi:AMPP [[Candida] subhashii]|uniref:Xaa-Pro aminopeptidase n=1 Tax=[Candida] subhashii TaxID=561895 RepID=A0A8J5QBB7_9ASCO|nr:AMPP [[Candida] subhashii]KAG7663419.1 AMPP [[Candida] subhashii]